jgi:hypothetical protein
MATPNINLNLTASTFILAASIALAYFSDVGWWAFAGLAYFIYAKLDNEILEIIALCASIILFIIAILNMGWVFF